MARISLKKGSKLITLSKKVLGVMYMTYHLKVGTDKVNPILPALEKKNAITCTIKMPEKFN